jgi:hypothetical protein
MWHNFLCFIIGLWCFAPLCGQDIPKEKMQQYETASAAMHASCPNHSVSVRNDTLRVAFFEAVGHYPELCDTKISLRYGAIKTSMAARPSVWSVVFSKREKRKYRLLVNKDDRNAQARLLYAMPYNASVGIMGHELAHILDYSTQSRWQIMRTGVRYLGKKYRRNMERQTDSTAIARGCGWQLYHFSWFVIYKADITEDYRNYKLKYYMTPEEIFDRITSGNYEL